MKRATLFSDGASSGNPGSSGIGYVIISEGDDVEGSEHIGVATNNVAEYAALIKGMERAISMGVTELEALLDSELVVKQLRGEYRVKNANLKPLFKKAQELSARFSRVSFAHIPREENHRADDLAKGAAAPGD